MRTVGRLWDTSTMVRPSARSSEMRSQHFIWKPSSPTASTSSTMRISGSTLMATAKASRAYMPLE